MYGRPAYGSGYGSGYSSYGNGSSYPASRYGGYGAGSMYSGGYGGMGSSYGGYGNSYSGGYGGYGGYRSPMGLGGYSGGYGGGPQGQGKPIFTFHIIIPLPLFLSLSKLQLKYLGDQASCISLPVCTIASMESTHERPVSTKDPDWNNTR